MRAIKERRLSRNGVFPKRRPPRLRAAAIFSTARKKGFPLRGSGRSVVGKPPLLAHAAELSSLPRAKRPPKFSQKEVPSTFLAPAGDKMAAAAYGVMKMFAAPFLRSLAALRRSAPFRYVHASVIAALLLGARGMAADFPFTFTRDGDAYRLTLIQNSAVYFGLQHTSDLSQPFGTVQLALGTPGPIFEYTPLPDEMQAFFRLEGIPYYAPHDSDFDGMDDIWELEHPYLDPLDPTDALLPSPNFPGLTNLDVYRVRFGLGSNKPQYYSREVSLFNFGAPRTTALSREISLFNFGPNVVTAFSKEVSVFNGEHPPIEGYPRIVSREVSLYNFGPRPVEAISREVSVFNGEAVPIPGYPKIHSREYSVFNGGAAFTHAVSREVSVFNDIPINPPPTTP